MKVQEIMVTSVRTCAPGDTLERAAQLLWEGDCGCLPVVADGSRVVGMLTDRDICMAAYTQGKRLVDMSVERSMSKTVWTVRPDTDLSAAESLLAEKQVHRLPVVDAGGRLVGLLSINDLARAAARLRSDKRKPVSDAEIGATLAAICEPRRPAKATAAVRAAAQPLVAV